MKQKDALDYLILGNHWSPNNEYGEPYYGRAAEPELVTQYFQYTMEGMETGLFAYVAHKERPPVWAIHTPVLGRLQKK